MATLTWTKFESWAAAKNGGTVNLTTDAFKLALSNVAPDAATDQVLADITQIANGNGYTTDGTAVTITTAGESGGVFTLAGNQVVFTASGGSMAQYRYYVLYDSTVAGGPLVMFADRGAGVILTIGQAATVKFNNANPGTILTDS